MDSLNYGFRKATLSHPAEKQAYRGPVTAALISLTILASSLSLPLLLSLSTHTVALSWLTCILCAVSLALLVKKTRVLILCAVMLLVTITLTGSPVFPALIFGAAISVGAGAALFCSAKGVKMIPSLLLPVLSFVISYLITGNIVAALTSSVIYMPMAALAIASRSNLGKTARIALSGGVLTAIFILSAGDLIYSLYGELTAAAVTQALDDLVVAAVHLTEYSLNMMGNIEVTTSLLRELEAAMGVLINLSFGLVCASSLIFAYFAQAIELCAFEAFGQEHFLTGKARNMTASTVSAGVFVLAYILSFTTNASNDASLVAIVATNICIILTPLFAYMGLHTTLSLPRKQGFAGILLSGIIVIAAFVIPSEFITILALVGAFAVMIVHIDAWAKEHYGKGENNE